MGAEAIKKLLENIDVDETLELLESSRRQLDREEDSSS